MEHPMHVHLEEVEVKRCYTDMKFTIKCPKCKYFLMEYDGDDQYLSYPKANTSDWVPLYCEDCDIYYSVPIEIGDITIEIDVLDNEITEQ